MVVAWRICKKRHPPFDGSGAMMTGARWNSPGRPVIYASDTFAGAILEILAHSWRPRTLPGAQHAIRIDIPDELIEILEPGTLLHWDTRDAPEALAFGDAWLHQARSAVLIVPAVPSRPVGRNVLINPQHQDAGRITVSVPLDVPWDDRLY